MKEKDLQTLLGNGLDFIESAMSKFKSATSKQDLKYGILHLSSGIELVLKTRLEKEHWALIFKNIDKASLIDWFHGDFESVTHKMCIDRLIKICEIKISDSEIEKLNVFRKMRNKYEHYTSLDNPEALRSQSAKVLGFVLDFIDRELPDAIESEENKSVMDKIRKQLSEFESFVCERMEEIQGRLESASITIPCPVCSQLALVNDENYVCYFCNTKFSLEDLVREFQSHGYCSVKEENSSTLFVCPECELESLMYFSPDDLEKDDGCYVCLSCGQHWELEEVTKCLRCDAPIPKTNDEICSTCKEYLAED